MSSYSSSVIFYNLDGTVFNPLVHSHEKILDYVYRLDSGDPTLTEIHLGTIGIRVCELEFLMHSLKNTTCPVSLFDIDNEMPTTNNTGWFEKFFDDLSEIRCPLEHISFGFHHILPTAKCTKLASFLRECALPLKTLRIGFIGACDTLEHNKKIIADAIAKNPMSIVRSILYTKNLCGAPKHGTIFCTPPSADTIKSDNTNPVNDGLHGLHTLPSKEGIVADISGVFDALQSSKEENKKLKEDFTILKTENEKLHDDINNLEKQVSSLNDDMKNIQVLGAHTKSYECDERAGCDGVAHPLVKDGDDDTTNHKKNQKEDEQESSNIYPNPTHRPVHLPVESENGLELYQQMSAMVSQSQEILAVVKEHISSLNTNTVTTHSASLSSDEHSGACMSVSDIIKKLSEAEALNNMYRKDKLDLIEHTATLREKYESTKARLRLLSTGIAGFEYEYTQTIKSLQQKLDDMTHSYESAIKERSEYRDALVKSNAEKDAAHKLTQHLADSTIQTLSEKVKKLKEKLSAFKKVSREISSDEEELDEEDLIVGGCATDVRSSSAPTVVSTPTPSVSSSKDTIHPPLDTHTDLPSFGENFKKIVTSRHIDYKDFKKIFNIENTYVTGSSVLKAITHGTWESGDIDIVTSDPYSVGKVLMSIGFENITTPYQSCAILKGKTKCSPGQYIYISNKIASVTQYRYTSSLISNNGVTRITKVDVIEPKKITKIDKLDISAYIESFDLAFCKNLFDGKKFSIFNIKSVIQRKHVQYTPSNRLIKKERENKYKSRGFVIERTEFISDIIKTLGIRTVDKHTKVLG